MTFRVFIFMVVSDGFYGVLCLCFVVSNILSLIGLIDRYRLKNAMYAKFATFVCECELFFFQIMWSFYGVFSHFLSSIGEKVRRKGNTRFLWVERYSVCLRLVPLYANLYHNNIYIYILCFQDVSCTDIATHMVIHS